MIKKLILILTCLISGSVINSADGSGVVKDGAGAAKNSTVEREDFAAERECLKHFIRKLYDTEGCGICKLPGADVFWFSRHSRCAHESCVNMFKPLVSDYYTALEARFPASDQTGGFNRTHIGFAERLNTVTSVYAPSIKAFIASHGPELVRVVAVVE
ncbi:MAG TPA: hypothetical protein VJJ81_00445, partial [Candidatus Babeliales bacterium]|nr:hypothetical protein [Candidatus Babeliales bacterium]